MRRLWTGSRGRPAILLGSPNPLGRSQREYLRYPRDWPVGNRLMTYAGGSGAGRHLIDVATVVSKRFSRFMFEIGYSVEGRETVRQLRAVKVPSASTWGTCLFDCDQRRSYELRSRANPYPRQYPGTWVSAGPPVAARRTSACRNGE